MYRLYLKNTEVEVPPTLQSLTFQKVRDNFYWGFIYNKIGTSQNVQLTFTEKLAIRIIRKEYEKNGIRGILPVSIHYFDELIYEGNIDFTTIEFNANKCTCTLNDPIEVDDFFSNQSTLYSVLPTKSISIPQITTRGIVTYKLDNSLSYQRTFSPSLTPLHTIPFKTEKESSVVEGSVYEPTQFNDIQNIYINTTAEQKTINVIGRIKVQIQSGDSSIIQVRLNDTIIRSFNT
jgi:hypothetical protein